MNRLTVAAAVAVAACAIGIPTVAALASDNTTHNSGPSHSRVVDDRSGPNRGSDDVTRSPSVVLTSTSATSEPGDDKGTHAEPGDDRGTGVEPGDDNGTDAPGSASSSASVEPGDDNGTHVEPGDDRGTGVEVGDDSGGHGGSSDDNSGHHGSDG
ncbi:MAG: hypothetical protein QOG07_3667 [Pseudonocardiales bacterium]|jgi:hypothetical protein|nr:hypothetical protein [Pseudonocardiales bacterium]